ncbi:MAG: hypothetical protein F7C07_07410 [Desulfurococcales archaeon]|nr:hypothetical protein [Desulfurococcales archaeon]
MSPEKIKREIIRLIDENYSTWVKSAFYSDPRVSSILEKLTRAWEDGGRKGIPIDYASREDLEVLLELARRYSSMSEDRARSIVLSRQYGGTAGREEGERGEGGLMGFIKRIIGRKD